MKIGALILLLLFYPNPHNYLKTSCLVGFVIRMPIVIENIQIKWGNTLIFARPDFGAALLLFVYGSAKFNEVAVGSKDGYFEIFVF